MELGDWIKMGTYRIYYDPQHELRTEARDAARKMWIVYSELVRAGFSEDQSLVLLLELMVRGKGENK
jgi:hypothetical protein